MTTTIYLHLTTVGEEVAYHKSGSRRWRAMTVTAEEDHTDASPEHDLALAMARRAAVFSDFRRVPRSQSAPPAKIDVPHATRTSPSRPDSQLASPKMRF